MCRNRAYYHQKRRNKWAKMQSIGYAPVNVQELDDRYELHVYAAGYTKEDFKLSLVDNILTVSVEQQKSEPSEKTQWKRREYWQRGFERQFELNDKINADAISATYDNGVLKVTLPKLEDKVTTRQDIEIE